MHGVSVTSRNHIGANTEVFLPEGFDWLAAFQSPLVITSVQTVRSLT